MKLTELLLKVKEYNLLTGKSFYIKANKGSVKLFQAETHELVKKEKTLFEELGLKDVSKK